LPRSWPRAALLGLLASFLAADACAILVVSLPWVRPSADGRSAQAYMQLTSTEGAKLVAASTMAAGLVTIRAPGARKAAVGAMPLPARVVVELRPGGYYIALDRLTRPLKPGDHVPLSLTIEAGDGTRQELAIGAEVRLHSAVDDELHPHHH
jgi:copper(I)-binding protein